MSDPVRVAVFFGGRSVEHEVSVITAQQAMAAMPRDAMLPVPVYIAKSGSWHSGDALLDLERFRDIDRLLAATPRVSLRPEPGSGARLVDAGERRGLFGGGRDGVAFDVALPLIHGSHGEDGTLQGLFELADVAYCGCGVTASAVSMDKRMTRSVLSSAGVPVLDDVAVPRERWRRDADGVCGGLETSPGYPMFVKPRSLGSSIGVARVDDRDHLRLALEVALSYDAVALAEPAQDGVVEINCSVLGAGEDVRVSVCEQPVSSGLLSYEDKYLSGAAGKGKGGAKAPAAGMKSAQRRIPAPISDDLSRRIRDAASVAFRAIDGAGVARVDFLVDAVHDTFVVNELNSVPGSLSFYLWEASGLAFADLLAALVDLGIARHREKRETAFSIDTWLLSGRR